jgi:rhodanese-related sulfurtransferase
VAALIEEKADIAILDARRFDEYATMSIPGGVSTPGAELVLRARAVAPDPDTTIIVNCAGRTRSIIGTQSLINAGLPNRIYALRNGTIGWTLAGQGLDHGQQRRAPLPEAALPAKPAPARAMSPIARGAPPELGRTGAAGPTHPHALSIRRAPAGRFRRGHLPGFRNAQGGNWCRKPTTSPRCAARASCWPTILARART